MSKIFYVASSNVIHDIKLIEALYKKGNKINVFVLRPQKQKISSNFSDIKYNYTLRSFWLPYIFDYILSMFKIFFILKHKNETENPDVVHGGNIQTSGLICSLLATRKFILAPFGSAVLVNPKKNLIMSKITNFVLDKANLIICDSETVRRALLDLTSSKKQVILFPRGVDLKTFNCDVEGGIIQEKFNWHDNYIILCNRAHYPIYNIDVIIKSFFLIKKFNPRARLLLMGYTPLSAKNLTNYYKRLIASLKIDDCVEICSPVPNKLMPEYLASSDIYVSASSSDGSSVSLLEAISMGMGIVVSDIPSNRDWISSNYNGELFELGNFRDLARKVLFFSKSKSKKHLYRENNISLSLDYIDWDKNLEEINKAYI